MVPDEQERVVLGEPERLSSVSSTDQRVPDGRPDAVKSIVYGRMLKFTFTPFSLLVLDLLRH